MENQSSVPKVFISYSWSSNDHTAWVTNLAERLRGDGVDVVLDKWDLVEGHDKYAFMERMVTDSTVTKVLIVCDKIYAEKADGRRGGVGTESQIISPEVYGKVTQDKFIPVIREYDDEGNECVPRYLKGRIYIDFSDVEESEEPYDQLLRNIFGRPMHTKPPLGQPPAHLFKEDAPRLKTMGSFQRLKNALINHKSFGHAILQEYFDIFLAALGAAQ